MREAIGGVDAKLYSRHGRVRLVGGVVGFGGSAGHAHKFLPGGHPGHMNRLVCLDNFSAVTAACMAIRHLGFGRLVVLMSKTSL